MQEQATELRVVDWGQVEYRAALERQRELHRKVVAGSEPATIVVVEHPPVVTKGRRFHPKFLSISSQALADIGIDLVATERGGDVTAHELGQLVVYPILPLRALGLGPKRLVTKLENAVLKLLATYGLQGRRDQEHPGIWLDKDKICAVGLRIQERVSFHGLALNVTNDLSTFRFIVPCGILGRGVARMADHLPEVQMGEVKDRLLALLCAELSASACPDS